MVLPGFNFAGMSGKTDTVLQKTDTVLREDQEQLPMEIIDKETGEVIKL